MNDNQLNSKIVQEDIELTEENKIESVYNNDRETNNKISDINQEENNYIDEQNLSSKNDVLNNEEKEENGLSQNKDSNNNVINGENPEEIQPQEDRNNLANDIQQNEDYLNENNNNNINHPVEENFKENNNMNINQNGAYNGDNYLGNLQEQDKSNQEEGYNSSNPKENLNYPNHENIQPYLVPVPHGPYNPDYSNSYPTPIQGPLPPHGPFYPDYSNLYQIPPQGPHYPSPYSIPHGPPLSHGPHFPYYPNSFPIPHGPPIPQYSIPPHGPLLPNDLMPPHGPPLPHYLVPYGIYPDLPFPPEPIISINPASYIIPHGPHYPLMPNPLYPPHHIQFNPPFPPHGVQSYPLPPVFPHHITPFPPHGVGGFPFEPPYPPHGFPHFPPHGLPHGPENFPHYGPHFVPPPNFGQQPHNEEENDVGFSSNNGQIDINNKFEINKFNNENVKGDYYSYEYNMDYRPNEYNIYPENNYNYYENERGFESNNNVYEENGKRNKIIEESKSIEDKINEKIDYERIPLYIDAILSQPFMSENTPCFPKINLKSDIHSFPIVIIHNHEFHAQFIDCLNNNSLYKEYKSFPVLKNKLILSGIDLNFEYHENHLTKNVNIFKFADITNSFEHPIYSKPEQKNIINEIKKGLNNEKKHFVKFMNRWINLVMDLLAEFIKFRLNKISYGYYCNNCHFPFVYFSDYIEEEFYIEENYNNLMINEAINNFNELIEIINIPEYNNSKEKVKENIINVICYEEEYNYMNYSFENEINGIFINCNNLKSFNKIMNEISDRNIFIQNKNSKNSSKIKFNLTNNYMFELIISAIYVDKIFQYLINNNYFRFIKGICILIEHKNNKNFNINIDLLAIKKKYNNYLKDLHVEQNDVFEFLKNAKAGLRYRNNQKYIVNNPIINFINYTLKYFNFHKYISFYYTKYPTNSSQIFHNIILDFLKTIDIVKNQTQNTKIIKHKINKRSSAIKKSKISNILNILQTIKKNLPPIDKNSKYDQNKEDDLIIRNNIEKYEKDFSLFTEDLNIWINNSESLSLEKLGYFIGSLMYSIDTGLYDITKDNNYNENNINNEKKENNDIILYKEFIGNYIDVLIHENNKYKIITFPSFLICSKKYENIPKKDDDKFNIVYIIKYSLNNQEDYIPILYDLNDNLKVFQLFTFFRITDIKIKRNAKKIMIYIEPINKKEYLELKLQADDTIVYNYNLNIMETIRYDNENKQDENSDNINSNNLYITASDQLYNNNYDEENKEQKQTKFMKFFNNKFGTDLNSGMTSLSLEEANMKNIGLLILSKTNLENLIVLNLSKNNISDISPFKYCNFPKLKKLSLESDPMCNPQDKITDISPLMHSNFPELFILNLKNNLISDISYLLFMNFPNLIILDLSYNQIESVYVFSEVNFPNLETLDLSNNFISDITPFISSGKKKQSVKNIDSSSLLNSSSISNFLSKSISNNEIMKKNSILPSLKILKIKNNKIAIDEGYLTTIKALKNRGITIFK